MLSEMKEYKNWVAYQLQMIPGRAKPGKVPYNPNTGKKAMANNPATWSTYDAAVNFATERARAQGLRLGQNHGVGFEFSNSPFAGIDLDHCFDDDGNLLDWARDIVEIMNSYTEYSPSGDGLHIIFKGEILLELVERKIQGTRDGNIELYYGAHFFTVTEKPYGEAKPIIEASENAEKVFRKYLIKTPNEFSNLPPFPPTVEEKRENDTRPNSGDLLEVMFNNPKNGDEIRRLYSGDITGYPSHSEADLALCNHLAFYTGNNEHEMDRLYRNSGLMRPKWDEKRGGQTYGEIVIEKAIEGTTESYKPYEAKGQEMTQATQKNFHTVAFYLSNLLQNDFNSFRVNSDLKTGFENLDRAITIYPGLYGVGAVTSLGKTTFCHQMADNMAAAGNFILFFSFEQSEFELATKGLSRLTYQNVNNFNSYDWQAGEALTAVEIRSGKSKNHSSTEINGIIERVKADYLKIAKNEIIIECDFDTTINDVLEIINKYAYKKPVVFIDYLQVISKGDDKKYTTKDAIDDNVRALKKASINHEIPIFLISSFNRENYLNVVDFTSFKESGGIEYTCDFLCGLQLQAMNCNIFNSSKELQIKRAFVRREKGKIPRNIELVILKNRFGLSSGSYFFDYYSPYDTFIPSSFSQEEIDELGITFKADYEAKHAMK